MAVILCYKVEGEGYIYVGPPEGLFAIVGDQAITDDAGDTTVTVTLRRSLAFTDVGRHRGN